MCSCAAMIETVVRLRVELEDWKSQNNKMQEELSQVRAQAEEMERKVEESKADNQQLIETKEALLTEGRSLSVKLEKLVALNKYISLRGSLYQHCNDLFSGSSKCLCWMLNDTERNLEKCPSLLI